jgi:hypothetical protein
MTRSWWDVDSRWRGTCVWRNCGSFARQRAVSCTWHRHDSKSEKQSDQHHDDSLVSMSESRILKNFRFSADVVPEERARSNQ